MSLDSKGCYFSIEVSHPSIVKQTFAEGTDKNGKESAKKAFLKAMEEFANSPEFEAVTYQLNNEIDIKVYHSINLAMPF